MKVVIIKYNAGNIFSVELALKRLGINPAVSDCKNIIREADKVIFPGVGEARSAMNYLESKGLVRVIKNLRQPVLGICLGLQLMCSKSEENDTFCINIFDCPVRKFPPQDKVPHIGWNLITQLDGILFKGLSSGEYVYFVHSYFAQLHQSTCAKTDYIVPFSAALQKDNFYAVQFHPEKSGKVGEKILRNFLKI